MISAGCDLLNFKVLDDGCSVIIRIILLSKPRQLFKRSASLKSTKFFVEGNSYRNKVSVIPISRVPRIILYFPLTAGNGNDYRRRRTAIENLSEITQKHQGFSYTIVHNGNVKTKKISCCISHCETISYMRRNGKKLSFLWSVQGTTNEVLVLRPSASHRYRHFQ